MSIQRVEYPIAIERFFLDYFIPRRPVIIRAQSLSQLGWRTELWTDDYLTFKAGGQGVFVLNSRDRMDFMPERSAFAPMLFQDFISQVMANPDGNETMYLNLQDFGKEQLIEPPLLQLIGDFSIPVYFKDLLLRCVNVWMGNSRRPIVTPLHHDFNDNLYVVVEGRKRFTLFPPTQAFNLYTRGEPLAVEENGRIRYASLEGMPHLSRVDIENPDLQRFPRYAEAAGTRVDISLDKNEMLFIPNGWFHQVSSVGRHIALSFVAVTPDAKNLGVMRNMIEHRAATA